jgi:hypothetical protein
VLSEKVNFKRTNRVFSIVVAQFIGLFVSSILRQAHFVPHFVLRLSIEGSTLSARQDGELAPNHTVRGLSNHKSSDYNQGLFQRFFTAFPNSESIGLDSKICPYLDKFYIKEEPFNG